MPAVDENVVDMTEASTQPIAEKPKANKKSVSASDLSKAISYINRGIELNQPRLLQRAIRQNANLRHYITPEQLKTAILTYVPLNTPTRDAMVESVAILPTLEMPVEKDFDGMDIQSVPEPTTIVQTILPETEVYLFTLIITTMMRFNLNKEASHSSTILINRIKSFNRRSMDLFSSKAFFYFSLSYERINQLEAIRSTLLALYRTSCLRRDEMGQAVLLNLILRNYLHYNLIEQAQTLASKTTFPENASNNQFCRYLYSMGRIQAIQLEYSEAYLRLMMAARKAPQDTALAFTRNVHKLAVLVQLLMGDIPERATFNQIELRKALRPYLLLTQTVRNGDLQEFYKVVQQYSVAFESDKNYSLVHRLGHNVVKTGLRKISISYSSISLADIAMKLHLHSIASAEYICAKAIRDGVIEATIDHTSGCLTSNEVIDVYSTEEPQKAFHRRIAFCLDVHNEAVKSMRYPPDAYKKELAMANNPKAEEKTVEELVKELEDDMDDL
eukprot:gene11566-24186_t